MPVLHSVIQSWIQREIYRLTIYKYIWFSLVYMFNGLTIPHTKIWFIYKCSINNHNNLSNTNNLHTVIWFKVFLSNNSKPAHWPSGRVIANGPGDWGWIPGRVIPKIQEMVLDTSLLNTQHYKVHFKGKVEQSRERSNPLRYTSV